MVAAKSTSDASEAKPFPPDPNSPQSTINTVEREIRDAGGAATAVAVDVRDFESVQRLVDRTVEVSTSAGSLDYFSLAYRHDCSPTFFRFFLSWLFPFGNPLSLVSWTKTK